MKTAVIIQKNTFAQALAIVGGTLLLFIVSILFSVNAKAAPATFTVTNTNDSGAGSLRQAIGDANGNNNPSDMDVIEFNIPGSEVHTISPLTQLPDVYEKLTIDGYTQPGAQENAAVAPLPLDSVIKIELDFSEINQGGSGLQFTANDSILRGLAIFSNNIDGKDILVSFNADNCSFLGNYGALRADGLTRVDVVGDVTVDNGGPTIVRFEDNRSGGIVGGSSPEDRNIIGLPRGTMTTGTVSIAADNVFVRGNYIGIAKDGFTGVGGNQSEAGSLFGSGGLNIDGSGIVIGGSGTGDTNVISGGSVYNLVIVGNNAIAQGNFVGTDYTGNVRESIIQGIGINITQAASQVLIGGINSGEGNIVRGVTGSGISMASQEIPAFAISASPSDVAVLGNQISDIGTFSFEAFGSSNLALDLFNQDIEISDQGIDVTVTNQGPTPNDPGDTDEGPNGYINTPILKSAQQVGNELTITYDLDAADSPSNSYRVEFFANDESTIFGTGPAQTYLGAATGVTPGTDKTITLIVNDDVTNKALSATTTAIDDSTASGFGSTSELSRNISVGSEADFDSDGITDSVEDLGPNNGDANNDGTPDRLQPTVTTYEIDSTGIFATLVTDGCSENGTVASIDFTSLNTVDTGYDYPYGLTDFTLNCSRGDTVNVTMYIHTESNPDQYVPRKYNPNTESFFAIPDSTLTTEAIGSSQALKLTYSITDGGDLDDDQTENGIIVDPVGIATLTSTTPTPDPQFEGVGAPNTGLPRHWLLTVKH